MTILLSVKPVTVDPPAGNPPFVSDAVIWADTQTEIGTVPALYAGYQLLRTMASHINLHNNNTLVTDTTSTVIYGHPTLNDRSIDQPTFLSSWSYTGETGTITVPDRDGNDLSVPVYYYSKSIASGTFTWSWRTANIQDQLGYFVGFFLFNQTVTVSAQYPALYDIIDNISVAYAPLSSDWWWDNTPSNVGASDVTATDWANLETRAEAASAGDVIKLTEAIYNDDSEITINSVSGTRLNPVILDISGSTLRGSTALSLSGCVGVRVWGGKDDQGTGNTSLTRFSVEDDSSWCSFENFWVDGTSQDSVGDSYTTYSLKGKYNRISNMSQPTKPGRGNTINFIPDDTNDTLSQFCLIQYCDFKAFNDPPASPPWVGQNNSFIRLGGNNNHEAEGHVLVRRDRFENWNQVEGVDSEYMVNKSCGHIVSECTNVNNVNNESSSGFFVRTGAWVLVWGIYDDCMSNSQNTNGINAQGVALTSDADKLETDLIHARYYVQNHDGVNGYLAANQVSATSSNRYRCKNMLVAEVYGYNCTDQFIRYNSNINPSSPENIHLKAVCVQTTTSVIDSEYTPDLTYESCYLEGSSLGVSPTPTGVFTTGLTLADNGAGIFVDDVGVDGLAKKLCIPVAIPSRAGHINLGTTYPTT